MGLMQEFKAFAMRGNVVDMAVGIIIGGAFGKIVSSFVTDVMMPPLGLAMGGVNFADKRLVLKAAGVDSAGAGVPEVAVNYGIFINVVIDFLIVAFAVFMMIKVLNTMKKKEAAAPLAPAAPPRQEVLLEQIRDLLAKR